MTSSINDFDVVWVTFSLTVVLMTLIPFFVWYHRRFFVSQARVLYDGAWYTYQTRTLRYMGLLRSDWRNYVFWDDMRTLRFRSFDELLPACRVLLPNGYVLAVEDTQGKVLKTVRIVHEPGEYSRAILAS